MISLNFSEFNSNYFQSFYLCCYAVIDTGVKRVKTKNHVK